MKMKFIFMLLLSLVLLITAGSPVFAHGDDHNGDDNGGNGDHNGDDNGGNGDHNGDDDGGNGDDQSESEYLTDEDGELILNPWGKPIKVVPEQPNSGQPEPSQPEQPSPVPPPQVEVPQQRVRLWSGDYGRGYYSSWVGKLNLGVKQPVTFMVRREKVRNLSGNIVMGYPVLNENGRQARNSRGEKIWVVPDGVQFARGKEVPNPQWWKVLPIPFGW